MKKYPIELVKETVTMQDLLNRYGFELNGSGFINCPFHFEKTASCKIYEKSFYCFGCNQSGDIFSFVMQIFNLSFLEAVKLLDNDFNLNLLSHSPDEYRQAEKRVNAIKEKRRTEREEKKRSEAEYWEAFDEWTRLTRNKTLFAPFSASEEWNPAFIEALKNIAYAEYKLEIAEIKRHRKEK